MERDGGPEVCVGVYGETDRKEVTQLGVSMCVCVCPWGITYHINNMTDCPASSLISCQSSIFSQQYLTLKSKISQLPF